MTTYLSEFEQRAIQAHNWISFRPEERGTRLINEFEEVIKNDLAEIAAATDEQKQNYITKFKSLFSLWISAKSNCASSMITGPSNFPVRRAQRANDREQKNYELLTYWRNKAKRAILKSMEPEKTFLSEIEKHKKDLANRQALQIIFKSANAIIRKAKGKECTVELIGIGLSESNARKIQTPDYCGRLGFAKFNMTNNLANIKRIEGRIKELESKEEKAAAGENKEYFFDGGRVLFNYEIDRLQIMHDEKPPREVIEKIKSAGFKWAPSQMAWQRQLTQNAVYSLHHFTGIKFTT